MSDLKHARSIVSVTDLVRKSIILPPDGGWGWVVVLGSFLSHFIIGPIIHMYGQFLDDISLTFETHPTTVGISHALMTGFHLLSGTLACALVKQFGFQTAGFLGGTIAGFAFLIASSQTSFVIFAVTIGVLGGTGIGLIYLSSTVVVGYYFDRWRAMASSIALCGTDFGIMVSSFYGHTIKSDCPWRIKFKFITAALFICCFFAMTYRKMKSVRVVTRHNVILDVIPEQKIDEKASTTSATTEANRGNKCKNCLPKCCRLCCLAAFEEKALDRPVDMFSDSVFAAYPRRRPAFRNLLPEVDITQIGADESQNEHCKCCPKPLRGTTYQMLNFKLLKYPSFALLVISNFFAYLSINIPVLYMVDRHKELGHNVKLTHTLYMAFAASKIGGRIFTGVVPSVFEVHPLTVYIFSAFTSSVASFLSYFFLDIYGQYIYICIFGFSYACLTTLRIPIVAEMYGVENLANGFGLLMVFQGLAIVVGAPIALVIVTKTKSYNTILLYCGSAFCVSFLLALPVRRLVRKENEESD